MTSAALIDPVPSSVVANTSAPRAPTSRDTADERASKPKRTKSEAARERWRRVRAGELQHPDKVQRQRPGPSPLCGLTHEQRAKYFAWIRDCPYEDAIIGMLREEGIEGVTKDHIEDFFQAEAEYQIAARSHRAAQEADALVRVAEKTEKYSKAMLKRLGETAFTLVNSSNAEPALVSRMAHLFFKAKGDDRAKKMQVLKRKKLKFELENQVDLALDQLAKEVRKKPSVRAAFELFRRELEGVES